VVVDRVSDAFQQSNRLGKLSSGGKEIKVD
jgi:ABC-type uncharacterized transport system auxiliary subunit